MKDIYKCYDCEDIYPCKCVIQYDKEKYKPDTPSSCLYSVANPVGQDEFCNWVFIKTKGDDK